MRNRRLAAILRACVVEHDWDIPLEKVARQARPLLIPLLERARYHGVVHPVYLTVRDPSRGGGDALATFEQRYQLGVGRHLRAMADLRTLQEVLDGSRVPWRVFKGPVLAEVLYPRPDLRSYGDLDILVERPAFREALAALERHGCRLIDQNWELIRAEQRGQLHIVLPFGTVADVHWHLLNRSSVRRSLSLPVDEVFNRARIVNLGGLPVHTLGAIDTLLHLCVHAALAGGNRLQWLKDIERAIAHDKPAWEAIVHEASAWGAGVLVGAMLQRARRTVGADVPDEVVAALLHHRVQRVAGRFADRVASPEVSRSPRNVSARWIPLLRDSGGGAPVLAARLGARTAARRTIAGCEDEASFPILVATGGEIGRSDFLDEVTVQ